MNSTQQQMSQSKKGYEEHINNLDIYNFYKSSPYLSIKHSSYFQVYSELLEKFRNKPITFVEIGVFNGGSLFMWRDYFGKNARIIGIDLNPIAKRLEDDGFEIYIGSQSDPNFWASFFSDVGDVDIIIDDGGHTNEQQVITAHECVPHIKDGGLLIVEDTHTSYLRDFGNPSKYSFIEWTKHIIDNINSRCSAVKTSNLPYKNNVYSITYFESIVCFKIQRDKCFESTETTNNGSSINAKHFTYDGTITGRLYDLTEEFEKKFPYIKKSKILMKAKKIAASCLLQIYSKIRMRKLRKYF